MTITRAGMTEYDRFGPWIDEVTSPDEVPPLYRDTGVDLDAARLVLKVPRNIARRDATPDMDLYDHLLVLDEAGLTVLSRNVAPRRSRVPVLRGYTSRTVAYVDIVAVRDSVELLDGRLTVLGPTGELFTVRYNGSARGATGRLVNEVRAATASAVPSAAGAAVIDAASRHGSAAPLERGATEIVFVNEFAALAKSAAGLTPWAFHGRRPALLAGTGVVADARRLAARLAPVTLHGGVVAGDVTSLEILGRTEWLTRNRVPELSRSRLLLPLGALRTIDVRPHPRYEDVSVVEFGADEARVGIAVPSDSDAHRLLADAARAVGGGAARPLASPAPRR